MTTKLVTSVLLAAFPMLHGLRGPYRCSRRGRNASNTEPARFVVALLKAKGAPILTPVKEDSRQ